MAIAILVLNKAMAWNRYKESSHIRVSKITTFAENVYRILFLQGHFSCWALFTYQN
jgi:hypothetical protein